MLFVMDYFQRCSQWCSITDLLHVSSFSPSLLQFFLSLYGHKLPVLCLDISHVSPRQLHTLSARVCFQKSHQKKRKSCLFVSPYFTRGGRHLKTTLTSLCLKCITEFIKSNKHARRSLRAQQILHSQTNMCDYNYVITQLCPLDSNHHQLNCDHSTAHHLTLISGTGLSELVRPECSMADLTCVFVLTG